MTKITADSDLWINDPSVCREADPNWDDKVDRMTFDYSLSKGETPEQAFPKDPEKRAKYIAFLKAEGSDLAGE